ncbi:IS66 Orf2 like protein [Photorhabdus australis subsp. thailandensis]|uniref:IS66 Orf2 like protein n=1 Tax=Photorhabdus australis subsp. thailandensis TaxID=2805096 RepID=A0A1C0U8Q5_9GAMM|nr:IS66 Orf2 like protein [Photorhabdus australis subsp. thailandensis]
MRRGIDALTQHLEGLNLRWQDEAAFIFCNKARSRLKVLRWDRHGVWLCTRRLHRAHFVWPKQGERSWVMTPAQFDWLILAFTGNQSREMTCPAGEANSATPVTLLPDNDGELSGTLSA